MNSREIPDFSIEKKLLLAGNVGDVGGVANPDPTVSPIPYKCDYVNPKTGAKECKSIGVIDTAKLARDMDKVCNGPLSRTDAKGKDDPGAVHVRPNNYGD